MTHHYQILRSEMLVNKLSSERNLLVSGLFLILLG